MATKFLRIVFNPEVTGEQIERLVDVLSVYFDRKDVTAAMFVGEEECCDGEAGQALPETGRKERPAD